MSEEKLQNNLETDEYPGKKKLKRKSNTKKSLKTPIVRGKAWTFPKNPLEDALRIPKAIEEKNAGNPMRADVLARAVGYKQPNDWRFLDMVRSANQYGLVAGSGANATISMEKLGQDIVVPVSPQQRQKALFDAFNNVSDFKSVAEFYGGKKIPEDEFFLNTLAVQFKIPRDRVSAFAEVFVANLGFLKAFDAGKESAQPTIGTEGITQISERSEQAQTQQKLSKDTRVRKYLDTCFVMMPFGSWFDRYYQDIYIPAIKEAGFEPIRADELFTTDYW